jgi:uncharacterized DUF497 family protein
MVLSVAGFDWDDGNWPKCARHGVSRSEIEYVLMHAPAVFPDRGVTMEERLNAIGRNADGRYLFVVFTFRTIKGKTLIRPISARYMHSKEVDHYERRKDS